MKAGSCPSCGAPVTFAPGSGPVKICEHCSTVVARGGDKLTVLGKVAELADTESPLSVGISGAYQGAAFRIAGRVQKDRGDGPWDEWCLSFEDQRTAWLAESEGAWNLMFSMPDAPVPDFKAVQAGNPITLKSHRFVVEEKGHARTASAQGQLPSYAEEYDYVDATGPQGAFVSVEYEGGEGEAFIGSRVGLPELGFSKSDLSPTPRRESLRQARCTQCNGMLDLKAPDRTKRVACPFCGALLDVLGGKLEFLQLLEKPAQEPTIPLGAKAKLPSKWAHPPSRQPPGETEWTCIAFLQRSCEVDGTRYSWNEYLLFNRQDGFAWLMEANGHWSFLRTIAAAEVLPFGNKCTHENLDFKLYQSVNTRTDFVLGECYWAVEKGETGFATEFVGPPYSLNLDRTENEVTWTFSELVDRMVIQKAFNLPGIQFPIGIAPAQVNPFVARVPETWRWTGLWAAGLIGVFATFYSLEPHGTLLSTAVNVPMGAASGSPESMSFSQPFQVPQKGAVDVTVTERGLSNQWEGLQTDLVNQETLEVISLEFELSEYHGYEDGESWSETTSSQQKSTAALDKGTYVVRFTPSFQAGAMPQTQLDVSVEAGSMGFCLPFFLLLLMFGPPIYLSARSSAFETKRWEDSVKQMPFWKG